MRLGKLLILIVVLIIITELLFVSWLDDSEDVPAARLIQKCEPVRYFNDSAELLRCQRRADEVLTVVHEQERVISEYLSDYTSLYTNHTHLVKVQQTMNKMFQQLKVTPGCEGRLAILLEIQAGHLSANRRFIDRKTNFDPNRYPPTDKGHGGRKFGECGTEEETWDQKWVVANNSMEIVDISARIATRDDIQPFSMMNETSPCPFQGRVALVIPFITKEIEKLVEQIETWPKPIITSTSTAAAAFAQRFGLIFLYHRDLDDTPETKAKLMDALQKNPNGVFHSFGSVQFISAKLLGDQDVYEKSQGESISAGTCNMFYPMFHRPELTPYDYMMYKEPDIVPIRDDWLSAVYRNSFCVYEPFWQKGSVWRGGRSMAEYWEAKYGEHAVWQHINGVSIYRLHDREFERFLCQVRHAWKNHSYDMSIHRYRTHVYFSGYTMHHAHKFQTSSMFVHGQSETREQILESFPDTYFSEAQ